MKIPADLSSLAPKRAEKMTEETKNDLAGTLRDAIRQARKGGSDNVPLYIGFAEALAHRIEKLEMGLDIIDGILTRKHRGKSHD